MKRTDPANRHLLLKFSAPSSKSSLVKNGKIISAFFNKSSLS
jgi:hypothetical protein